MRKLLLAVAVLALAPALARAAQAYAVSVEELARASALVVRGRVTGARSALSADGRRVHTAFDVKTIAAWKGKAGATVRVLVPGGTVGDLQQSVDAAPTLARGEEVVLFLLQPGETYQVAGLAQGKFTVDRGTARPDLSHLQFIRTTVAEGERRAEDMPLRELERRVRKTR